MVARLVQIEGGRRIASSPLRGEEILLGRDPTSDIILDYARVSRRHAVIRRMAERHTLEDYGSSNGTLLNGQAVGAEPVLLKHGDVVELARTVALLYEFGPARGVTRWVAAAAVMVCLALASGGLALWRLRAPDTDPALQTAAVLARDGYRAFEAGDPLAARQRLQRAAGILFLGGALDDVPRADVMRAAMERLSEKLTPQPDLWSIFRESLAASAPSASPLEPRSACRLDRRSADELEDCLPRRIAGVLLDLRQDPTGAPAAFHSAVARQLLQEHARLESGLIRGQPYVGLLRHELERAQMPTVLHYVALIESGYRVDAVSPAKAAGLWQLLPSTARQYGLIVSPERDDRRDPVISTRAAAHYLRDLASEFGGNALLVALAGYERGESRVREALKQLEHPFDDHAYWRLLEQDRLPEETASYVARFVAAAVAGEAGLPARQQLERAID